MIADGGMTGRVLKWAGAAVATAVFAGLAVYFVVVGLDKANKLASVIGLFVGLAGLGVTVHGLISGRSNDEGRPGSPPEPGDEDRPVSPGNGGGVVHLRAEVSGRGRVYQAGRDLTINER